MEENRIRGRVGSVRDGFERAEHLSGAVCKASWLEKIAPIHVRMGPLGMDIRYFIVAGTWGVDKPNGIVSAPRAQAERGNARNR